MTLAVVAPQIPAMEMEFRGETLLVDPRGCLFWPKESLLVVSDLHLEKGSSFAARKGSFMPPYDTHATLEQLALCVTDWQPKTIVSLGDSFHDEDATSRLPQSCRLALNQLMEGREWIWISGNHDPIPPENLGGIFCTELMIGPINFLHEPLLDFAQGEIAGHLHPAAKIRRRGKAVRRRCFAGDGKRLIMPAFGAFTGGLNVKDEAFDGLFSRTEMQAWLLGKETVYRINGQQLVS
ncbi:MAG: ligase-associated DNA damage response endonuclease PdeM [Pseudomonadota bacterium]